MKKPIPTEGTEGEEAPRRLRRAEAVLARRSRRILLVLEGCSLDRNHQAVMRTAECFGVQHLWLVDSPRDRRAHRHRIRKGLSKGTHPWLSLRHFPDTPQVLAALRGDGRTIWVGALSRDCEVLEPETLGPLPERLALVMGNEATGASPAMLAAAERRLYLPVHGFCDSYNLSVAAALFLQRLFDACPEARGDLDPMERAALREDWYRKLARKGTAAAAARSWIQHPPAPLEELRLEESLRRPRILRRLAPFGGPSSAKEE